jgi:ankyrin repeat protein
MEIPKKEMQVDEDFAAAISEGDEERAAILLTQGADINRVIKTSVVIDRDVYEETTTYLINASLQGSVKTVQFLLAKGADPNIAGIFSGRTALLAAARFGHLEVVETLLQHGAVISAIDSYDKYTAMDYAISQENAGIVRCLFAAGARGSFHHLRFNGEDGAAAREIARLLLEHGADVNAEDDWGRTPLMWAAERAPVETVQFLIDSGADIHRISGKGSNGVCNEETALQLARRKKRDVVVALLLQCGASPVKARYER